MMDRWHMRQLNAVLISFSVPSSPLYTGTRSSASLFHPLHCTQVPAHLLLCSILSIVHRGTRSTAYLFHPLHSSPGYIPAHLLLGSSISIVHIGTPLSASLSHHLLCSPAYLHTCFSVQSSPLFSWVPPHLIHLFHLLNCLPFYPLIIFSVPSLRLFSLVPAHLFICSNLSILQLGARSLVSSVPFIPLIA